MGRRPPVGANRFAQGTPPGPTRWQERRAAGWSRLDRLDRAERGGRGRLAYPGRRRKPAAAGPDLLVRAPAIDQPVHAGPAGRRRRGPGPAGPLGASAAAARRPSSSRSPRRPVPAALPSRAPDMAARGPWSPATSAGCAGPTSPAAALTDQVDQAFASYARYWAESLRLPGHVLRRDRRRHVLGGRGPLEAAMQAGRGAILALPHLGGWEWAGVWLIQLRAIPMTVVVEALEPPELFEWFVGFRRRLGMEVVPVGPARGPAVLRALRAGHVVCLLCDRNVGGTRRRRGRVLRRADPACRPARPRWRCAPARRCCRPRCTSGTARRPPRPRPAPVAADRHGRGIRDDVLRVTQALAGELEILIRRAPTQWHLMQPNWPSDPGYGR